MRDAEGNRGRDWETAVGSWWAETEKWETRLKHGSRELRRDGGTFLGGGEEGREERLSAGRDQNEEEREIRKGFPREMEYGRGGPWQRRLQGAKEVLGELDREREDRSIQE